MSDTSQNSPTLQKESSNLTGGSGQGTTTQNPAPPAQQTSQSINIQENSNAKLSDKVDPLNKKLETSKSKKSDANDEGEEGNESQDPEGHKIFVGGLSGSTNKSNHFQKFIDLTPIQTTQKLISQALPRQQTALQSIIPRLKDLVDSDL